jgi:hypothetical protein
MVRHFSRPKAIAANANYQAGRNREKFHKLFLPPGPPTFRFAPVVFKWFVQTRDFSRDVLMAVPFFAVKNN